MQNAQLYNYAARTWSSPIQLVFCAFNYPRKGFPLLVQAYNLLNSDDFHLHIVGDWESQLGYFINKRITFHGLLAPEQLKTLYQSCHVFINCSISDHMALDGFPTTAAVDAMATGCLLVTTNPRNDQLILKEGIHYIKIDANVESLLSALYWIRDHLPKTRLIAAKGAKIIKSAFDMKKVVKAKLAHMLGKR